METIKQLLTLRCYTDFKKCSYEICHATNHKHYTVTCIMGLYLGSVLAFEVDKKTAFEIPLKDVSAATTGIQAL